MNIFKKKQAEVKEEEVYNFPALSQSCANWKGFFETALQIYLCEDTKEEDVHHIVHLAAKVADEALTELESRWMLKRIPGQDYELWLVSPDATYHVGVDPSKGVDWTVACKVNVATGEISQLIEGELQQVLCQS